MRDADLWYALKLLDDAVTQRHPLQRPSFYGQASPRKNLGQPQVPNELPVPNEAMND